MMRAEVILHLIAFISIQAAATEAEGPPINVTMECNSYGVVAYWQYPYDSQDVRYKVEVTDDNGEIKSLITYDQHLNISNMLWNPAFNRYFVEVTAQHKTENHLKQWIVKSKIFSFSKNKPCDLMCQLDFPKINLSPKDGKLHVQFSNPLYLYRNSPALHNVTDDLIYYIKTNETKEEGDQYTCDLELKTCETYVVFANETEEYCINLAGNIGQRYLRPTTACFTGDLKIYPPITDYLYPVLGAVSLLMFIACVIMLLTKRYHEKIKRKALSDFSKFLDFKPTRTPLSKPLKPEDEKVASDLQLEPVDSKDDSSKQIILIDISSDEGQSLLCHSSSGNSENYKKDEEGCGDPYREMYSSGPSTGYDCPHNLRQEMSPGDSVECYGY